MAERQPGSGHPLGLMYQVAQEQAREFVSLILVANENGTDEDGRIVRGQIRQYVRDASDAEVWLLIHVLARAVANTYDDLNDWSSSVIEALAAQEGDDE